MTVWDHLQQQKADILDRPPTSFADIKEGFPEDSFNPLYEDADADQTGNRYLPFSYYSKSCGWAADYVFMFRRVAGYLNPGHLKNKSLDEYVLEEFGCRRDTLASLIADGWFIPQLADQGAYAKEDQEAIADLLSQAADQSGEGPFIKHVQAVDLAIEAMLADRGVSSSTGEEVLVRHEMQAAEGAPVVSRTDLTLTQTLWEEKEDPWCDLPDENVVLHGVSHRSLKKFVTERAVKLGALASLNPDQFKDGYEELREGACQHQREELDDKGLAQLAYTMWNFYGTPAFYCDFSGTVDVGPGPAKGYIHRVRAYFRRLIEVLSSGTEQVKGENTRPIRKPLDVPSDILEHGPEDMKDEEENLNASDLTDRAGAFDRWYTSNEESLQDIITGNTDLDGYGELLGNRSELVEDSVGNRTGSRNLEWLPAGISHVCRIAANAMTVVDLTIQPEIEPKPVRTVRAGVPFLLNLGAAALKMPTGVAGYRQVGGGQPNVKIEGRQDVTHVDIWQVPYERRSQALHKFRYVLDEAVKQTLLGTKP